MSDFVGAKCLSSFERTTSNLSESGEEFAVLRTDFLTKNSNGGIKSKEFQTCGMIKMW